MYSEKAAVITAWPGYRSYEGKRVLLVALTGVVLNHAFFNVGLSLTTATNAVVLQTAVPVYTAALSVFVFKLESLNAFKGIGMIAAFAGALIMLGLDSVAELFGFEPPEGSSKAASDIMAGNLFILANTTSFAVSVCLSKPLLKTIPPAALTSWTFSLGNIGMFSITLIGMLTGYIDSSAIPAHLSDVPISAWGGLVYAAVVGTTLVQVWFGWCVKHSSAMLGTIFHTLRPMIVAGEAYLLLGEKPEARHAAGGIAMAIGIAMVTYGRSLEVKDTRPFQPVELVDVADEAEETCDNSDIRVAMKQA